MINEASSGKLAAKLARILGEIGKVPKSGRNTFHNYDYVTENDLVYAVRQKLADNGVFVFTSVEAQETEVITGTNRNGEKTESLLTKVTTRHTFVDGESGEQFSVLSQGQGADNGDKGGYKAITGAMKYFLYKCFMIPTGDDPEQDAGTDERGAAGASRRQSQGAPREQPRRDPPKPMSGSGEAGLDEGGHIRREVPAAGESEKFADGKWRDVVIHFGSTYKGTKLGDLSAAQLGGWLKWTPQPFKGKINPTDLTLRAALDAADAELGEHDERHGGGR